MEQTKLIERELDNALAKTEANPVSPRCAELLGKPLEKETCQSFREVRRRNMCRAWEIMEKERIPQLGPALSKAWSESREQCAKVGVYSPEEPAIEKTVALIDKEGKKAGTISLMKDGYVEFCQRDIGCGVSDKPSPESYYLTEYFFSEVYGYGIKPTGEEEWP